MCGFVAAFGNINKSDLINATNLIQYRGPDQTNFYINEQEKIYLGHNRLEIIDIKNGKQPMLSHNQDIILLFNGEIYNHLELRKSLIESGYQFYSANSDTEVILAGYQLWGNSVFDKLDGQFSICIINKKKNKIVIARDKFGEKPLFYFINKDKIIIGSELNIFKKFSNINFEIDNKALKKFFVYSFVPPPLTIFKNIYKLEHATYKEINLLNNECSTINFYTPDAKLNTRYNSEQDYIYELESIIDESVKSRLISDVEVGLFLSGGLDSSLVGHFAKKNDQILNSFSISIEDEELNEKNSFNFMNNHFGIKNNVIKLDSQIFNLRSEEIFKRLDEPIGAPTYLTMFFLSEFASKKLKVVLTGDGADEIFGGYEVLAYQHIIDLINKLKINKFTNNSIKFFSGLFDKFLKDSIRFKLHRFSNGIKQEEYLQNTSFFSTLSFEDLNDIFFKQTDNVEIFEDVINFDKKYSKYNSYQKSLLYFINFYIPNLICSRSDRAGMYNSLEIRSPFLNEKIVNFMLTIPPSKSYLLRDKTILKKIASRKIHKRFANLKKGGFTYPMDKWLEDVEYKKNLREIINIKNVEFKKNNFNLEYRNFFHCMKVINNFVD